MPPTSRRDWFSRTPRLVGFPTNFAGLQQLNAVPVTVALSGYQSTMIYWGQNFHHAIDLQGHVHSFYEACYVARGKGRLESEGKAYPVSKGSLFLTRPNTNHRIDSKRAERLGVMFWAFTLSPAKSTETSDASSAILTDRFIKSSTCVAHRANQIEPLLQQLAYEIHEREPGLTDSVTALTTKLLLDSMRLLVDHMPAKVSTSHGQSLRRVRFDAAARMIDDNLGGQMSVADIAQKLSISDRQLRRLFSELSGMPVARWILKRRIEAAGRLLLEDIHLPVKAISIACGFSDVSHFTAQFRKIVGHPPAEYRRLGGTIYENVDQTGPL